MVVECAERGDGCVCVRVCAFVRAPGARRGLEQNSSDTMPRVHEGRGRFRRTCVCVWCMGRENAAPLAGSKYV